MLGIKRSSLYYRPVGIDTYTLLLMYELDKQYTETPFYGVLKMTEHLRLQGHQVNVKRVRRLLRQMGLEAVYPKPKLSQVNPEHKCFLIVPHVFILGIIIFLGWLLLIGGIFQIIRAVSVINMPGFSIWFAIGLLQTVIGYFLVTEPAQGSQTLTLLLAVFFAIEGLAKTSFALMMRPLPQWGWAFFSGITALALAIVVWAGWPQTGLWVLGLLLGINMIFLGWSLIKISLHHKTFD